MGVRGPLEGDFDEEEDEGDEEGEPKGSDSGARGGPGRAGVVGPHGDQEDSTRAMAGRVEDEDSQSDEEVSVVYSRNPARAQADAVPPPDGAADAEAEPEEDGPSLKKARLP
jgi:hypothetical protein